MTLLSLQELKQKLMSDREKVDQFIAREKKRIDAFHAKRCEQAKQHKQLIDKAEKSLRAFTDAQLESETGDVDIASINNGEACNDENQMNRNRQDEFIIQEPTVLKSDIAALNNEIEKESSRLKDLDLDEKHANEEAKEARKLKESVEAGKARAISDLNLQVNRFRKLGLDFEAENGALRFNFKHVDPNDPEKTFFLTLKAADETGPYSLVEDTDGERYTKDDGRECIRISRSSRLCYMIDTLNKTDDLSKFAIDIRKEIIETL